MADHLPEGGGHRSRKSIANFKLREPAPRRDGHLAQGRMYDFSTAPEHALQRVALHRAFGDALRRSGQLHTLAEREQIIFPEINTSRTRRQGHEHHPS